MISKDDALNIAILAALVAFLAWAVPSRMAENADALQMRAVKAGFR